MSFTERPVLVFWEVTRACPLACAHCRASAIPAALPGELTTGMGRELIDQLPEFGVPAPTLILSGGDPLQRPDLFELIDHARHRGLHVALSPAVSTGLTSETFGRLRDHGVASISISLDGGSAATHERIRGTPGHFQRTLAAIRAGIDAGLKVQVNSTVMAANVAELAALFGTIRDAGVRTWEVFFLIRTGRGAHLAELDPRATEDVSHFLYDASRYGVLIRGVEAPFLRRVLRERTAALPAGRGPLYVRLHRELESTLGPPTHPPSLGPVGTLDGDGILFVGYDGTLYPGGFLPSRLGAFPADPLVATYRGTAVLRQIRARAFRGPCGICSYRTVCGGSRARAFAHSGDVLGSDPACQFGHDLAGMSA